MEVRITFRSEVYLQGKDMKEIREKWEELPLYSSDAILKGSAEFVELTSVEDAEDYKDLAIEFFNAYSNPIKSEQS
jgi:hypothetical protein